METEPNYKIGDKVRIVNYGHLFWTIKNQPNESSFIETLPIYKEDDNIDWIDANHGIVGKEGVVSNVSTTQGVPQYSIKGIPEKSSWYNEGQMELIEN